MKAILKIVIITSIIIWTSDYIYSQNQLTGEQIDKLILQSLPDKPTAKPKKARKVLIFTLQYTYYHESTPTGVKALTMLGKRTGAYEAVYSNDISMFEPNKLKQFDAMIMLNTMGDLFTSGTPMKKSFPSAINVSPEQEKRLKQSLQDFVSGGKGLIGIHAATASFAGWPEFGEMLGAYFSYHPEPTAVWIKNEDPDNPVNKAFGGMGFQIKDEIYRFTDKASNYCKFAAQPYSREKLHVLLSLDFSKEVPDKGDRPDKDAAISWIKTYGKGRVFYCGLGHFDEIYWNPAVVNHYLAGIQFALGDLPANSTPRGSLKTSNLQSTTSSGVNKEGYISLFNGKDLSGWEGDPRFWSVKNGIIIGKVDEDAFSEEHSYLFWNGGDVKNFELHLKFRWGAGNSGIEYRAARILKDNKGQELKYTLEGYQADITKDWMNSIYNWNKPGAEPGQFVVVDEGQEKANRIDSIASRPELMKTGYFKQGDWNDVVIIARGTHILQRLNEYLTTEMIDNGKVKHTEGLIGMQIHRGKGPQEFEFKDIYLKKLNDNFGAAKLLFNGHDFNGWSFPDEKSKNTWTVTNNFLVNTGKSGSVITENSYKNYVLRFQFKPLDEGQAALMLHLINAGTTKNLAGIKIIGNNGDFNKISAIGNLHLEIKEPPSATNAIKKPQKFWNDCEIISNDGQIEVKVNNVTRVKATGADNLSGMIGFDANDGRTLFRNIVLIPILN